ncbi:glycosyltransferase family 4 protein [uncultured Prevotella sp.]|uniref:glycosyltransferase family 4 protein n=1 Tax=uncultured Prevotella sp. TaxID=159272 RepID=UPI0025E93496|nr:glycosyltransferase family 4 protein [uncultured Prevotella sp.]
MKIVVTGTRGIPNVMGGVETHCEELFPRIAAMGEDVTVIRRKSYVNDGLKEWKDVKLVDIETPKKKSFEAIIHTYRAINMAKKLGADILHIHAIGPALLTPYAKMLGMKVVFTHHGPDYDRDKWGKAAKMVLKLGERMGCMFADDVIVISDVIRNLIKEKYGRTKNVHLIYNGVSKPEICDYPEYFEELGIKKGRYILGMCRFVPEKNLHHLVEAFNIIKNEELRIKKEGSVQVNEELKIKKQGSAQADEELKIKKQGSAQADEELRIKKQGSTQANEELKGKDSGDDDIKLVLAGDTDFEDDYSRGLKEMARKNGVVLTGFVKGRKLHSLLTNCMCYCLPSSHEGLPIALLEAMSYGVKVIVSDIPANLEVGLPQNDYFHVGNVDELAKKLNDVMTHPVEHIEYDMTKYDWDKIAREVRKVYLSEK